MIVITGEIEMHAEDAWPASTAAVTMMEASAAEDGCLAYRIYMDLLNPRLFRIYEEWRDEAALAAHFASPHMAKFQEIIGGLRIVHREIKKFTVDKVETL